MLLERKRVHVLSNSYVATVRATQTNAIVQNNRSKLRTMSVLNHNESVAVSGNNAFGVCNISECVIKQSIWSAFCDILTCIWYSVYFAALCDCNVSMFILCISYSLLRLMA